MLLSIRYLQTAPFDKREEADKKRQEMCVGKSDHLTLLEAYKVQQKAKFLSCVEYLYKQ